MEMVDQINQQMMATPVKVQLWMNWMGIIFVCSIFFVYWRMGARLALAAFAGNILLAYGIFAIHPNVHLFGIAHYILWGPLLFYIVKAELPVVKVRSLYGVWLSLLSATIVISLVFDARDIVLVAMGYK